MDRTTFYLDKAAECLDLAEDAPQETKAALISLAEQYTRLAAFAAQERDNRPPGGADRIEDEE